MSPLTKRKIAASLNLTVVFAFLVVCFQNCSPYHAENSHLSSISSGSAEGAKLYKMHCASCHGSIDASTKSGRSASQISAAIMSVLQMNGVAGLKALTSAQINEIALALNAPPVGSAEPKYTCVDPGLRGITADKMRRLTSKELKNTLRDLLGTQIYNDSTIQSTLVLIPEDKLVTSAHDLSNTPSNFLPQVLFDVSARAVTVLGDNAQLRAAALGSCTSNAITEACVRSVISQFGKKVLRRPPTTAETDKFVSFYQAMGGGLEGLKLLVGRLLQSPTLVFHIEEGSIDSNGRTRLTNYEVASRISYMTANTMPDQALFDAADSGALQSLAAVKSHVDRFLSKSDGMLKLQDFIRYYARLNSQPMPNEFIAADFGVSTVGLGSEMQTETSEFIKHIVFNQGGTFEDLLTSTAAFPRSPAMAKILETTVISTAQPVANAANHPGLLHRPGLLASSGGRTSPILRGAQIRKVILCDVLADPPDNEVLAREDELGNIDDMPNRDRAHLLTSGTNCVGCHSQINPLGFPFENYNQLGARRAVEPIFDSEGRMVKTFPIDTKIDDAKIEAGGPTRLNDSVELVKAISTSMKARACYSTRMFEYYTLRPVDETKDGCALSETEELTASNDLRSVLINSIANEDIFWRKQPK